MCQFENLKMEYGTREQPTPFSFNAFSN